MKRLIGKAAYVTQQPGDSKHHCHWPGCARVVPPAMWGCKPHWYQLPQALRDRIWRAYKPGQEISKTPSSEYIAAAREVQAWIEQQVSRPPAALSETGQLF